jgi:hypothetical protein
MLAPACGFSIARCALEQEAARATEARRYIYIFCDRAELPDLDDAAIEATIAAGTATRRGSRRDQRQAADPGRMDRAQCLAGGRPSRPGIAFPSGTILGAS